MSRVWAFVLGAVVLAASVVAMAGAGIFASSGHQSDNAASTGKCDRQLFGRLSSVTRHGDGYLLKFDPALFTSGVTANTAAAEDGKVEPGEPVPNDNYVVDESHRLYVYVLPADAHVTVLTNDGSGITSTSISVDQLRQLVAGKSPVTLFEGLDTGFWMTYTVDTVCSLEQQYHP